MKTYTVKYERDSDGWWVASAAATKRLLAKLAKARAKEVAAGTAARKAAGRAVRELTERMNLSRRDAAVLTGYSFQRIQQLAQGR